MQAKICIADGIEADSLIGQKVYFEAKRTIRTGDTTARRSLKRRGGKKPFYDMIPGKVVRAAPGRVAMEAAGGIYSRARADVVLEQDLAGWILPPLWTLVGWIL